MGPMNEFAQPVGFVAISYYPTQHDADNDTNLLGTSATYQIGNEVFLNNEVVTLNYTSWRIASRSTGPSPQIPVYENGQFLIDVGGYFLYPPVPCFLEGSTILCQVDGVERYVPVEELGKGTLVKTSLDGYKPVVLVGKGTIQNPGNDQRLESRLYKYSPSNYPELKDDLYITGGHSILKFSITEKEKEDINKHFGRLFVTDKKYRLMAWLDERAEPWNSEGTYPIRHFALEHSDEGMNYGVYANGGLLVETSSIKFLKNKSNMTLL
jgi:hypothetical protein